MEVVGVRGVVRLEKGRKGGRREREGERDMPTEHLLTPHTLLLPFVSRESGEGGSFSPVPEIHKLRIFRRVENFRII